jgi:hypothetical protein
MLFTHTINNNNRIGVRDDMLAASDAYTIGDSEKSVQVHQQKRKKKKTEHSDISHQHEEKHALFVLLYYY